MVYSHNNNTKTNTITQACQCWRRWAGKPVVAWVWMGTSSLPPSLPSSLPPFFDFSFPPFSYVPPSLPPSLPP